MFEIDIEIKGTGSSTYSRELILKRLALIDAECEEATFLQNLLNKLDEE